MSIDFNILSISVFTLIANGVFASALLILKNENKRANVFLSALTLILSLWLCDTFFRVAGIYEQKPELYFLPIYFSFGFGPLIYFYTVQLTKYRAQYSYRIFFHFIPVFFQFLFYCYLQLKDYAFRREFWLEVHRPYTYDIELALSFASLMIYLLLSRKQISRYRLKLENSFSNLSRITLNWLNQIHLLLFVLSLFWLFETLSRIIWNFYPITPISSLSIGIVILFIAIGGILQKDLRPTREGLIPDDIDPKNPARMPEDIDSDELKRIQQILVSQELFLIPSLSLKDLSQQVGLSERETSRLINKGLNLTFIDFINNYRIKRFKELAVNKEFKKLSLLGIAYESGFNSKSTFNRVFKKMEGKSPSAYLKESHIVN